MDPDPRILITGLRIRILLFFPVAPEMLTKNDFFGLLLTGGTFTSVFKDAKLLRSHKTV
jgi:hypothetical protein